MRTHRSKHSPPCKCRHRPSTCAERSLGTAGAWCPQKHYAAVHSSWWFSIFFAAVRTPGPLLARTPSARTWGFCRSCCCSGCRLQSVPEPTCQTAAGCASADSLSGKRAVRLERKATEENGRQRLSGSTVLW